ncbi:hypothetical protein JY651_41650 [Pyxidicoccus parkwayensis]|uniref:Cytochrome b561 domain-containing protein n=1 Tax=Pyxidicoccus parkwayensis TaxID=2813578 RepID=A0ABX7NRU6_9BACT|nr:hypothetical protein [Pyxidicoccus parkwaysis]QSQ21612.1 hypothetical protein JY651_41650 [Pyxidicoccus parkwaysis]
MTRFVALTVILSLLSTSNAWAQRSTSEPTKKSQTSKKKPSKSSKRTKAPPAPTPASPTGGDEEQAAPTPMKDEPASDAPKQQQQPSQKQPETQGKPPSAGDSSSLDFDLLEEPLEKANAAQANPELEQKIHRRRTMLKLHQGLGFALTASLLATTVVGQLQYNDSFRGGGDDRNLLALHRGLAIGTSAIFATVGLLGLLAPEPFKKEFKWDTITFHKIFMSAATLGMLTQVLLGIMSTHHYGKLSERDYAFAHQVVGYTTLGLVSAGVVTLFF